MIIFAKGSPMTRGLFLRVLSVCGLVFLVGFTASCSNDVSGRPKNADARKKVIVPVTAATALVKPMPKELRAIGNVQASATVAIKSRVGGELLTVHFKEGDEVKTGDPLFSIDPRPFEASLKQAEAKGESFIDASGQDLKEPAERELFDALDGDDAGELMRAPAYPDDHGAYAPPVRPNRRRQRDAGQVSH